MKTLWEIMAWVTQKERFVNLDQYIEFAEVYLEFIEKELQAELVAKNENNYHFFQYRKDGDYNITRPVNTQLFFRLDEYEKNAVDFVNVLSNIKEISEDQEAREKINRFIYTTQQSIPSANASNKTSINPNFHLKQPVPREFIFRIHIRI